MHAQHAATGDVRGLTIVTLTVVGNGNENHFLRPAWNLAQHQYVTHYIPRPLYDGGGVALRHDEVRRRRKRHPSMEVIVNGFNIFRCFERLQNWNVRHTEDFPF